MRVSSAKSLTRKQPTHGDLLFSKSEAFDSFYLGSCWSYPVWRFGEDHIGREIISLGTCFGQPARSEVSKRLLQNENTSQAAQHPPKTYQLARFPLKPQNTNANKSQVTLETTPNKSKTARQNAAGFFCFFKGIASTPWPFPFAPGQRGPAGAGSCHREEGKRCRAVGTFCCNSLPFAEMALAQKHVPKWHLGKWNQRLKPA